MSTIIIIAEINDSNEENIEHMVVA